MSRRKMSRRERWQRQRARPSMKVDLGQGALCPRCGVAMQRWKHADAWTPPTDKGWYEQWDECMSRTCPTKQVMSAHFYRAPKPGTTIISGPVGGGMKDAVRAERANPPARPDNLPSAEQMAEWQRLKR